VTDERCPNSKVVAIAASKIFAGDGDIIPYCATVDPLDWSTPDDAGYLPFGLQTHGANPVSAMGLYRGNLVAFNSAGFQMWQVDQDPANMALLDAAPIGSTDARAIKPLQNDLVFLNPVGVRNISIAGASTNLQAGSTGEPVDALVGPKIRSGEYDPISAFIPAYGQYWVIFGPEAFVLTLNEGKGGKWSRYVFPEAITDTTLLNNEIDLPSDYPKFLRPSRQPTGFEPNYNDSWWTLDKLRAYVEMYPETNEREAGNVVSGQSEAELRKSLTESGLDEDAIELRVEQARYDMFARGKLRVMDLNYVPPTKAEFDAYWARKGKEKKSA
jgi:hypothetical protein